MSCGGRCDSCGSVNTCELRRLVGPYLPDVRVLGEPARPPSSAPASSSTVTTSAAPRPVLTPARRTVAVPVRAPMTPSHVPVHPPPAAPHRLHPPPGHPPHRPPDREAAGSDLTMEVLANQAHELSGLVWQEDPRRIGDLGVEVVEASLPVYGEDRRQQLEREIYALLHGDDGAPYCRNIDEDVLTWITDSVRSWSNRDRTLWLCDPDLPAEEQQMMGIRVDIRVRSHIRNTGINGGKWMKQRNWVKPAFFRPRDTHGAAWDRLQRESPISENAELPVSWSDTITFSHRDVHPRAYMGRLVVLSGDQDFGGRKLEAQNWSRKNPPIPLQPSRFMICTDDDKFGGNPKEQTPKSESIAVFFRNDHMSCATALAAALSASQNPLCIHLCANGIGKREICMSGHLIHSDRF